MSCEQIHLEAVRCGRQHPQIRINRGVTIFDRPQNILNRADGVAVMDFQVQLGCSINTHDQLSGVTLWITIDDQYLLSKLLSDVRGQIARQGGLSDAPLVVEHRY